MELGHRQIDHLEYSLVASLPLKLGSPGVLPPSTFESLCIAVKSFISINKNNMNDGANNTMKNLALCVNGCIGRNKIANKNKLLDSILQHKSIALAIGSKIGDTGGLMYSMNNSQKFDDVVQQLGS